MSFDVLYNVLSFFHLIQMPSKESSAEKQDRLIFSSRLCVAHKRNYYYYFCLRLKLNTEACSVK